MISAKSIAMAAVLTLAGEALSQEKTDEQRLAELIEELNNSESRGEAFHRVVAMGRPAVHVIRAQIEEGKHTAQHFIMLGEIGPEAAGAFPLLLKTVPECPPEALVDLFHGLVSLWVFLPAAEQTSVWEPLIQALIKSISETDAEDIRKDLAVEYVRLGDFAVNPKINTASSLNTLVGLLPAERPGLFPHRYDLAARLLGMMGAEAKPALPNLLRMMKSPIPPGRSSLGAGQMMRVRNFNPHPTSNRPYAEAILSIDPRGPEAVEAHAYLIEHGDSYQRRESVIALRGFGQTADVATPALGRASSNPSESVSIRYEAITTLGMIGSAAKAAIPTLEKLTNSDEEAVVRYEAITALGMIGPEAKAAIPTLEKLTQNDDPQIAERAKAALRQVAGLRGGDDGGLRQAPRRRPERGHQPDPRTDRRAGELGRQ